MLKSLFVIKKMLKVLLFILYIYINFIELILYIN